MCVVQVFQHVNHGTIDKSEVSRISHHVVVRDLAEKSVEHPSPQCQQARFTAAAADANHDIVALFPKFNESSNKGWGILQVAVYLDSGISPHMAIACEKGSLKAVVAVETNNFDALVFRGEF